MSKPSKASQLPPAVRTLNFHGCKVHEPEAGGGNWIGDCPFCGKEEHFYLEPNEGTWDCKVCSARGNVITFLGKLVEMLKGGAEPKRWQDLEESRSMPAEWLKRYDLVWNGTSWLLPVYSETGTVRDLPRYDGRQLMCTAGVKTQLYGIRELVKTKRLQVIHLCEGHWDRMALEWLLHLAGVENRCVVALPGANTFKKEWLPFFSGKIVVCHFDNDTAGDDGAVRAQELLKGIAKEVSFCNWPDHLKQGYDVRDFVKERVYGQANAKQTATLAWAELMELRQTAHRRATAAERKPTEKLKEQTVANTKEATLEEVKNAFRKKMKMTKDLEDSLVVALSVCLSNDLPGDPLWVYLVGPPGSGKTMILSALADSERCVFRSTVTPHCLVSGWQGSGGDPSLIPKLVGCTFVAKDFTEVLSMPKPAQDEIFSTLRGAYDGMVQKSFGNGVERIYDDCRFSMLAGVTSAIHAHKGASLGERFLKMQIKRAEGMDADALVAAAIGQIGKERETESELREVTNRLLSRKLQTVDFPRLPEEMAIRLGALVQMIAILRAVVERDQRSQDILYRPVPEAGTRLAKQLARLSMCVAVLKGENEVSEETFSLIRRVAYDTAHGFYLDVLTAAMELGAEGFARADLPKVAKLPSTTVFRQIEDLVLLGVVIDTGKQEVGHFGGHPTKILAVDPTIAKLWRKSMTGADEPEEQEEITPELPARRSLVLKRKTKT